jgi:hypothetical protein
MSADTLDRERLVKLCGMFGSAHIGERANAAAAADRLVRRAGLRWSEIIVIALPTIGRAGAIADQIDFVVGCPDALNEWERSFAFSLARRRRPLTEKQLAILQELVTKCRSAARAAA